MIWPFIGNNTLGCLENFVVDCDLGCLKCEFVLLVYKNSDMKKKVLVLDIVMYKKRVENDIIFFWNSCSFILWMKKSSRKWSGKIQNICYFEFSHSGFPHSQDKRAGISKKFLSFFTLFFYIPWLDCLLINQK